MRIAVIIGSMVGMGVVVGAGVVVGPGVGVGSIIIGLSLSLKNSDVTAKVRKTTIKGMK